MRPTPTRDEIQAEMIEAVIREWNEGRSKTIIHAATGTGKCVDPMTWVWSNGLKRFKDVFGQEATIAGPHGPAQIAGWHDDGVNPGVHATLDCGITIDGTLAHRVWARTEDGDEGWVYMEDLTTEHYVAVARGEAHFGTMSFPPEEAYALGLAIADASIVDCGNSKRFQIDKQKPVLHRIKSVLEAWCKESGGNGIVRMETKSERHEVATFHSKGIERYLSIRFGMDGWDRSLERSVPRFILESNKNTVRLFLMGLFDGDGYCSPYPEYSTGSRVLAEQIYMLLTGLGVFCKIKTKHTSHADAHVVVIKDIEAFRNAVGFRPYGLNKDRAFLRTLRKHRNTNTDLVQGIAWIAKSAKAQMPVGAWDDQPWKNIRAYASGTRVPSRKMLSSWKELLPEGSVSLMETERILSENRAWSKVVALRPSSIHRIDCEVAEQHAFIGNGIINHNTVTAAKLIAQTKDMGKYLFLADMRRLVEQTEDKFHRWGLATAVEMGDRRAKDSMALMGGYDVVIATRQTLGSPKRLALWRPDEFQVGIIDECQSAQGATIKMIMSYFTGVKYWVGLSATPYRADGKPLVPDIFESIAYHYPLKDYQDGRPGAISNGHLVPVRMVECNVGIDLRGLKKTMTKYGKDYSQQELEDRISKSVDKMANGARMEMKRLGVRKAIHFTPDVKTAYAFESAYSAMGLRARAIHGENPDRDGITRQFDEDELDVIISCQLLNVGVDFPSCDCAIMGRPTKSHGLAMQQIGRITRISPETGKTVGWVIGFAWECDDEGPVSTLDLFFEDEPDPRLCQIGREIARNMRGQDFDPLTILEMAKKQREREKEDEERRERAREAREKKKADTVMRLQIAARERAVSYRRRELDPLGVALASPIQQPVHNFSHNEVNENIKNVLRSYGIHDTRSLTPDQALKAVEFWADRDFRKMSSYGQVKFLMNQGWSEERALGLSREEARCATNDRFAKFREMKSK